MLHLKNGNYKKKLYRIFVYDCPPFTGVQMHPLTRRQIHFGKTEVAEFKNNFHDELKKKRLVALRYGHIQSSKEWKTSPQILKDVLSGKRDLSTLSEQEIVPDFRQKGVDIKIGIDIASLAFKKLVDQIVLISGDSDFVPAAKLARREGIDFILDPMWNPIMQDLHEHIDGLRTIAPKPEINKE
ncbi:MAG: NYN domain-containing protein [Rhodospirillales bacterium]|nr:NYN domain-containing protein [Rhodospirillales bacterium]